jgi:hemolysin activation/secretion protein
VFAQHLAIAVLTTVSVCSSDPDPLSMTPLQNQNQSILLEQRKQPSSVLIGELKGILLLGKETSVKTSGSIQGIEWTDLAIPGRPYDLWKELSVFLNQPVTAQTIKEIKEAISAHYLRESHPFVAIRVPEQEVTSGTLRLIVRESKLGTISVEGNCHFSAENIKSYYNQSKPFAPGNKLSQPQSVSPRRSRVCSRKRGRNDRYNPIDQRPPSAPCLRRYRQSGCAAGGAQSVVCRLQRRKPI